MCGWGYGGARNSQNNIELAIGIRRGIIDIQIVMQRLIYKDWMKNMNFISNSEQDTYNFAHEFAKNIENKTIICLNGELGAGKTVFVKGFAKYFGVEEISSPTFTIVNEYFGTLPIYHFDVYRLMSKEDFYDIGGEEYFDKGICIIEWSGNIKGALPNKRIEIDINKIGENAREIVMNRIK